MVGVIILAAGEGTRMKSDKAKVLHEIDGAPMINYVLDAVGGIDAAKVVIVVGHKMEEVIAELKDRKLVFAIQLEQLGTAHAVLSARAPFVGFDGLLLVLYGDTPLVTTETLRKLIEHHRKIGGSATVLTGILADPAEYGRIIRDGDGNLDRIVEYSDADKTVRAINEVNSGISVFESNDLWPALKKIDTDNVQGELYLTDVIEILKSEGKTVAALSAENPSEIIGVNDIEQLKQAGRIIAARKK